MSDYEYSVITSDVLKSFDCTSLIIMEVRMKAKIRNQYNKIPQLTQDTHTWRLIFEIISTVILLPSAESFKKGCCQLQAKVYAQSTG